MQSSKLFLFRNQSLTYPCFETVSGFPGDFRLFSSFVLTHVKNIFFVKMIKMLEEKLR